jgi:hypothetical protein
VTPFRLEKTTKRVRKVVLKLENVLPKLEIQTQRFEEIEHHYNAQMNTKQICQQALDATSLQL